MPAHPQGCGDLVKIIIKGRRKKGKEREVRMICCHLENTEEERDTEREWCPPGRQMGRGFDSFSLNHKGLNHKGLICDIKLAQTGLLCRDKESDRSTWVGDDRIVVPTLPPFVIPRQIPIDMLTFCS